MSFAGVVGHRPQIDFLRRALAGDRLAHALFLAGPPGIGKRLVADALAGLIVCESGGDDACGECPACRQLAARSHPDVLLVSTAKREISIERVRELNGFLRLQRMRARYKLAIIDDAHLLNLPAQNALLKGLEEPPAHSITLLIAANADALLPTVRSRAQRIVFGPLSDDDVCALLTERHDVPAEEARGLAAFADGSPGRALRLRTALSTDASRRLADRLANLGSPRYGALVPLAGELGRSDESAEVGLEALLRHYRAAAASAASDGETVTAAAVTRRAGLVIEALAQLRRRNPNRPLLLESLLLRLAHP